MTRDGNPPETTSRVRIFITAKSADYEFADRVHRFLRDTGLEPFFSRESLPELGNADYRREIDRALDEADHMVVVASSLDHVLAPWVEAEWGFFVNEKRAGRKNGNVVTLVIGGLKASDLPPSLRYSEVLQYDPDLLDRLLPYVQGRPSARSTGTVSAAPLDRRPLFRELATFGGPPRVHLLIGSPEHNTVATGGLDGAVRLYKTDTRMRETTLASQRYWAAAGHEGAITALEFSPDGGRVASGHLDGSVHAWEIEAREEIEAVPRHDSAISGLVFSADGHRLASASKDGVVKLSNLGQSGQRQRVAKKPAPVVAMARLRTTGWLMCGLINASTRRYVIQIQDEGGTDTPLATIPVPDTFTALAMSPDNRCLVAGGRDGVARLYDLDVVVQAIKKGENPKEFPPLTDLRLHRRPISSLAFFPDSRRLATCAMDASVTVWDLQSSKPIIRLQGQTDETFAGAVVLDNGATLAGALTDGRIRLWDVG